MLQCALAGFCIKLWTQISGDNRLACYSQDVSDQVFQVGKKKTTQKYEYHGKGHGENLRHIPLSGISYGVSLGVGMLALVSEFHS